MPLALWALLCVMAFLQQSTVTFLLGAILILSLYDDFNISSGRLRLERFRLASYVIGALQNLRYDTMASGGTN